MNLTAPELIKRAVDVGLDLGWDECGRCYAMVPRRANVKQRQVFEALRANVWTPEVMYGRYYAGNFGGEQ